MIWIKSVCSIFLLNFYENFTLKLNVFNLDLSQLSTFDMSHHTYSYNIQHIITSHIWHINIDLSQNHQSIPNLRTCLSNQNPMNINIQTHIFITHHTQNSLIKQVFSKLASVLICLWSNKKGKSPISISRTAWRYKVLD